MTRYLTLRKEALQTMKRSIEADLHIHSVRSDGSETREWILQRAKEKGLQWISFTEHDSTIYTEEGIALGKHYGITVIPGVEMSTLSKRIGKRVHILGYGFSQGTNINNIGHETLAARDINCRKQIAILKAKGYDISSEQVSTLVKGGCIYKQHIMEWLVRTGQCEELFGDFYKTTFKNGGICDFDICYPEPVDAVKAIVADGGYPVLAHPGQQENYELIPELVEVGLKGLEWNHPANSVEAKEIIEKYANEYSLFLTGGSDFHGRFEVGSAEIGSFPSLENPIVQ